MGNEIHIPSEVALDRLSCCCVFCEEVAFLPCCQQANTVTKMASEAVLHYATCLLQSRCASRRQWGTKNTLIFSDKEWEHEYMLPAFLHARVRCKSYAL